MGAFQNNLDGFRRIGEYRTADPGEFFEYEGLVYQENIDRSVGGSGRYQILTRDGTAASFPEVERQHACPEYERY